MLIGKIVCESGHKLCAEANSTGSVCGSTNLWGSSAESEDDMNSLQFLQLRWQKRVAPVCGILWFYHIPKTGGSSVANWLKKLKAGGVVADVLDLFIHPFKPDDGVVIDFQAFDKQRIQPWLHNMTGKLLAVNHHHGGPGLYGMDAYFMDLEKELSSQGCSLTRFTILREPYSQLVSAVNYALLFAKKSSTLKWKSMTRRFDGYDPFRRYLTDPRALGKDNSEVRYILNNYEKGYCPLEVNGSMIMIPCGESKEHTLEAIELGKDNSEVRNITNNYEEGYYSFEPGGSKFPMPYGGSNEHALEAAMAILDGFEFVGVTEELGSSLGKIAELLHLPNASVPHLKQRNVNDRNNDMPYSDDIRTLIEDRTKLAYPDDIRSLLKERTKLDVELYRRFASKFSA